jgi:hypothetical protein
VWIYRGDVLPEALPKAPKPEQVKVTPPKERKGWRRVGVVTRPEGEEAEVSEATAPAIEAPVAPIETEPTAPVVESNANETEGN